MKFLLRSLLLFLVLSLSFTTLVAAKTPGKPRRFSGSLPITVTGLPQIIVGEEIIIDEPVTGDLIIAGGQVEVRETVTGDLIIAGGQVELTGNVGEDLIVIGGEVDVNSTVGKDVIAA